MTFNEGMQIDTSTTSSSGGGRGRGRGIAIGGGVGGLLIVVVALFLGVDPSTVIPQQSQMNTQDVDAPGFDLSKCKTGKDANSIVQCRVVATGNSVDGVWQQQMPGYTRPRVELFNGQVGTGCGTATSDVGPFYCPADQTAYFDTDFFDVLVDQFGSSGGPLAQEYVVAHEFGHHVQNLKGVLGRAQQDPQGATGGGVRTELQADCYAGVWAHYAAITKQEGTDVPFLEPLTESDIADALSAASSVGDDRIQASATGRVNPESWTHGSSEQRQKWFTVGYQTGDPAKCDTFATNNLARPTTAVDAVADRYLEAFAALDPCAATQSGITGFDDQITDYSPDGATARAESARTALRELDAAEPVDDVDVVTVAAMRERLGVLLDMHTAHLDLGELNVIASPLQTMRNVFDLMATDTEDDWVLFNRRLSQIPRRVAGYADGLRAAVSVGRAPAGRQIERAIEQSRQIQGLFIAMVADAAPGDDVLSAELGRHAVEAASAYASLATVLREDIGPHAREVDACGRDAYTIVSRAFLGAVIDLDEAYHWGLDQVKSIVAEQDSIADRLYPGTSAAEALQRLNSEPRYILHGIDALQHWMQSLSDRAMDSLADQHFDIAEELRTLECRIAPTRTGGIYYTGPSEDLSRPGRMWWSVPDGVDTFHTWQETTTVFHEGVPGHHLQIGRAVMLADQLNRWRRLGCWVSGHGEGWALYAERLMAELGWLDDDGSRMGMLDAQRFRAARVVIDVGVHCGLAAPDGGTWDADRAWNFLQAHSAMAEEKLRFELDRYLSWPGQAPSYAIGQRIWQQLRDETQSRGVPLKEFHSRVLDLGGLPLDVLRDTTAF